MQSQVLNLMVRLQRERNLTYVFISHDLSVVEYISDTIAILYLGRIVEVGPVETIFQRAAHPYTRALIEAIPVPDPTHGHEAKPLEGEAPSALSPPPGCPFHPRCPFAIDACREAIPALEPVGGSKPGGVSELLGVSEAVGSSDDDGSSEEGESSEESGERQHLVACIREGEI